MNYSCLLCLLLSLVWLPLFAQPLTGGSIYRLGIPKTGIYRINQATLAAMGINLAETDPRNIRIFSSTGGMLPQPNSTPRAELAELAIFVQGEQDGRFDNDDFILFYAQGADRVVADRNGQLLQYEKNLYDDLNYCFLVIGNTNGKRIRQQSPAPESGNVITTFNELLHHERDEVNLVNSGRRWFGERFDFITEHTIRFPATGWVSGTPVLVQSAVVAQSVIETSFGWQLNGQEIGSRRIGAVPISTYARRGNIAEVLLSTTPPTPLANNEFAVRVRYDKAGNNAALGHLDYVSVNFLRRLQLYDNATLFRSFAAATQTESTFRIANAAADLQVWDVSNLFNPQAITLDHINGEAVFSVANPQRQLREYAAFRPQGLPEPRFAGAVAQQNLRGTANNPDLLIVTAPQFLTEAQRLAEFRRRHDGLAVEVATTAQIYNEFASGRQDLTAIRDFARLRYLQPQSRLKYLLLFGDASFDYKDRNASNTNFVPVYQSYESLHPIFSFSSDDYFGFFDANEGAWDEDFGGAYDMEIGVGRLPAKTAREAAIMVDKLIHYTTASTLGNWRSQLTFVADDGDFNIHLADSELLSAQAHQRNPNFRINKIYIDAFEQVATPTGRRSPAARDMLNRQFQDGSLIVNYTGHGSETGWASEAILDVVTINNLTNYDRLPLMVTATCEFGRYDNPFLTSGAEFALLSPRGGAIALLTTTRPVFSSTNFILNEAFYNAVFTPINGDMPRLGDIQRLTKNNSINGVVNRNFALLGDPSMRLAYPAQEIAFTTAPDTLKALATVTLAGEIRHNGVIETAFDGTLKIEVLEKEFELQTLGDEDAPAVYRDRPVTLFRGEASVQQGRFSIQFTVPKNIDYSFGEGRIKVYAMDPTRNIDAIGAQSAIVGGTAANVAADNTPPRIRLFMDNEQFQNGGRTAPDAELLAFFEDDSGINISSMGIGQDITATLNRQQTFVLNSFYRAAPNDSRRGSLRFPLRDLPKGEHTIRLKAWDVHNNPAEAEVRFVVAADPFRIDDVKVFPNPFVGTNDLRWQFTHNRTGDDLEITLAVYDITGRVLMEEKKDLFNVRNEPVSLDWGKADATSQLNASGIYLYRITVASKSDDAAKASFTGRLLVIK
ncbi:type IX secretion system sortase PorU [Rhodoflexus sp.]